MRLLGNSIVPQCALFAFRHIAEHVTGGFLDQGLNEVKLSMKKPNLHIVVEGGTTRVLFPLWPTPRAQKTSACSRLTSVRIARDLPTTLQFSQGSQPGVFNVNWVEWLMGYPKDWTLLVK